MRQKMMIEPMTMTGKVRLPVEAKVIGCTWSKVSTVPVLMYMYDPNGGSVKDTVRSFATVSTGAVIDGEHQLICQVPETDLFLFELFNDAKVTR